MQELELPQEPEVNWWPVATIFGALCYLNVIRLVIRHWHEYNQFDLVFFLLLLLGFTVRLIFDRRRSKQISSAWVVSMAFMLVMFATETFVK
jgi:hypothetical protein